LRTSAIPERLRGVITTRRYTNPRLPFQTHFKINALSVQLISILEDSITAVYALLDEKV